MKSWQREFEEFDRANPNIYHLFRRFAFEAQERGFKHFGAKAIMERVRWEVRMDTTGNSEFKINNNFTAFYARKLMRDYPSMAGFFRTRSVQKAA